MVPDVLQVRLSFARGCVMIGLLIGIDVYGQLGRTWGRSWQHDELY